MHVPTTPMLIKLKFGVMDSQFGTQQMTSFVQILELEIMYVELLMF